MSRANQPQLYVVADPTPRLVRHCDSPQERLNAMSPGLIGPVHRLGSSDSAVVLAAAADIVTRLKKAGLDLSDLADKIDSDPKIVWYPTARVPATKPAAKLRRAA